MENLEDLKVAYEAAAAAAHEAKRAMQAAEADYCAALLPTCKWQSGMRVMLHGKLYELFEIGVNARGEQYGLARKVLKGGSLGAIKRHLYSWDFRNLKLVETDSGKTTESKNA